MTDYHVKHILKKLTRVQRSTAILGCDLAFLLGITESYVSNMRRWAYVSPNMAKRITIVLDILETEQKKHKLPMFEQLWHERGSDYKIRRRKLVERFKKLYVPHI